MRLLGRVQQVSHDGNLVVKASFAPETDGMVVDSRKQRIGRIAKVFGPTRTPYVTIKPESGLRALAMIGQELYVPPEGDDGKDKRRDGRDRKMSRVQQFSPGKRSRAR
ncbi:MAG: Gar1/Naf1 family protein [Thermoplasmata archaeon]|nr:Gar1/Naf1 family protein [Thermoplasmata archaeon]